MNVLDYFNQKRPWSEFWSWFAMLDSSTATKARMAQDKEIAQQQVASISNAELDKLLEADADPTERHPTHEGYGLTEAKLDRLADKLELLRLTLIQVMGGKSKEKFKPEKRPRSAFDKALDERKWQREKEVNEQEMRNFGF